MSDGQVRRFDVGLSVDALASAWARQERAPSGSVVVAATEISGRQRGGVPWTVAAPNGLMLAMVARPAITPDDEALLWLAVTLAGARAIESQTGQAVPVIWPDTVGTSVSATNAVGTSATGTSTAGTGTAEASIACSTNVGVQLGPNRIEHAILSARFDLTAAGVTDRERLLQAVVQELHTTLTTLESQPLELVEAFTDRYPHMGRPVTAWLLPRGSARGRVAAIDPAGDLVLESPTGMLERVMAANLRRLELA